MEIHELYQIYLQHPSIVTDTRKILPDSIFFALKGPKFNGNHFAAQALEKGAAYCIADEDTGIQDERIIRVTDTLQTLQELAKNHRLQFKIPFIAITGSNGKTTTKELVHAVLSSTFKTYTTQGNLNNHIGIPLTLLQIKPDAEIAIIEMGANHADEIKGYCQYTMPTHGLITNCGKAHLEGFGSEEGVRKAKGELFDYLRIHNGSIFIFNDYEYLLDMSKGIKNKVSYGTNHADYTGIALDINGMLCVKVTGGAHLNQVLTQLVGSYNLPNVLAAITIGKTFKVPDEKIKESLEAYSPGNSRSQLLHKDGNKIILDAYNANPSSMKLAIENFASLPGNNKIVFLGSMMEMGDASDFEHQAIVDLLLKKQWEYVVLAGPGFKKLPAPFIHFNNSVEAGDWFKKQNFTARQILIKGSRSMQMEKILE
ncbi:MAG: UDP-N-acetylmuramoyl-tripeptide--D-alanyl-D-alanine ligase [Niastella sp.]|nr:UDP-N-acetylmuramoyl-tripeptide--D-alanyl-D-alanine ligase [Niastella sp.]